MVRFRNAPLADAGGPFVTDRHVETMRTLRVASFGVRGFVGESLTPQVVIDLSSAFGTFVDGGRVLVGRDTRLSSRMLHSAVISGLLSTGCDVLDCAVCPTPLLQFATPRYDASGAVSVSGGHNAAGWNALTLIGSNGAFMEPVGGETVLDIYHARHFSQRPWDQIHTEQVAPDFKSQYFDELEALVDVDAIRKADLTVVIDPVNGAGSRYVRTFADRLGFNLVAINAEESGYMAHDPEPTPRNARQVASVMQHVRANVGFVSSSDMGRLCIVAENGQPAAEEYSFALVVEHRLQHRSGAVVTNCCTTRTVDDLAESHGARLVKTPVGQAYVMSALADEDGVIGGEGNGSAALPEFSRAFDAFLMMALILERMATSGRKMSELLEALPRYHIVKHHVRGEAHRCYRAIEVLQQSKGWMKGGRKDLTDGIRVDWWDGWVHVRASRTESMVRIISESKSRHTAEERASNIVRLVEQEL